MPSISDFKLVTPELVTIQSESFEYFPKIQNLKGFGHIYLVKCGKFFKIGLSGDVSSRLRSIQSAIPYDIEIIDTFISLDTQTDEKRLHSLLSEYAHRNEWFELPASMIKSRSNWFYSSVAPSTVADNVRKAFFQYIIQDQEKRMFEEESILDLFSKQKEQFQIATVLSVLLQTSHLAIAHGVNPGVLHNDRYRGLYRKTAAQLRECGGVKGKGTPLDVMSSRDNGMNWLANQMAVEADDPSLLFDAANGIRDLYKKTTGKELQPIFEAQAIRPSQAKVIAFGNNQMELVV